jgi:hypothetical protein
MLLSSCRYNIHVGHKLYNPYFLINELLKLSILMTFSRDGPTHEGCRNLKH